MAIEGPLKELGIHDVFQLLDLNRKTGILRVTSSLRHNQGGVWLESGVIVYAEIRSNPHQLGQMLVRAGKINEADVQRARDLQKDGDERRIGQILTTIGALTPEELERYVRFQVEEVVLELMSWQEGYFSFVEQELVDVPVESAIRIRIEALLMEGARRIDEWSRMQRKIPHVGVVPALTAAAAEDGQLDLLPDEWEVLAMIDGMRDIRGIATSLAKSEFDVAKTIFGMESADIVAILSRPSNSHLVIPDESAVERAVVQAEQQLQDADPEGARSALELALNDHPHDARLLMMMGRVLLITERAGEAEEILRRALRLDSSLARAHRLLGDALARQGRLREASAWWGRWITITREMGAEGGSTAPVEAAIKAAQTLDAFLRA